MSKRRETERAIAGAREGRSALDSLCLFREWERGGGWETGGSGTADCTYSIGHHVEGPGHAALSSKGSDFRVTTPEGTETRRPLSAGARGAVAAPAAAVWVKVRMRIERGRPSRLSHDEREKTGGSQSLQSDSDPAPLHWPRLLTHSIPSKQRVRTHTYAHVRTRTHTYAHVRTRTHTYARTHARTATQSPGHSEAHRHTDVKREAVIKSAFPVRPSGSL